MTKTDDRLAGLFQPHIATYCTDINKLEGNVYPQEEAIVAKAVQKRRQEFFAGRVCARRALLHLNVISGPILRNDDRTPGWPSGIVGSITHTGNFCGVAVAKCEDVISLGLDAESISDVERGLWDKICTPKEMNWVYNHPLEEQQRCAALIFSAKESFYKCQYMVTKQWIGFHEVEVCFDGGSTGLFEIDLLKDVNEDFFESSRHLGKYSLEAERVYAGIEMSAKE